jgi:hypothetical protein
MKTITTAFLFAFLLIAPACGDATSGGVGAPPPAASGAAASPVAAASVTSDGLTICQQSCAQLAGCGVSIAPTCVNDCLQAPIFVACARGAGTSCNALALCGLRQSSALFCGGEFVGAPRGNDSCDAVANCTGNCTLFNQGAGCACACTARLHPEQALNLTINNTCAAARCPACRVPGDGIACIACFQRACAAESARCAIN